MQTIQVLPMTIPQMEERFKERIANYGILWHTNYGCTQNSTGILMGNHMTMYYPLDKKLSRTEIRILKDLVEWFYYPVVYVKNHPKDRISFGDSKLPSVHSIDFVFETVDAARRRIAKESRE